MRSTLHALIMVLFLLVSIPLMAQKKSKKKNAETQPTMTDTTMQGGGGGMAEAGAFPYTADYSSKFTMGNPEHARMVLSMWKDYDNNTFDRSAAMLADTVMFQAPNGMVIRGKDSVLNSVKQFRGQFSSVKSTVDAWVPMHSTDRNEDWVLIWGTENDTNASGSTTNVIHEIWRVNRDGKIDFIRQYTAKPPVQ
ncbi:nuclear transport factor 2 family protein [Flavisolibacter tropicus]|nr:nuclear transport factor 2 family protein [Flavisolibacter tropicus]